VSEALRGETTLKFSSVSKIKQGQIVWVNQIEPGDGPYLRHLHADQLEGGSYAGNNAGDLTSKIRDVQGNTIVLERPLRTDVRLSWQPVIREFKRSVTEVGIEILTMEFPEVAYSGLRKEPGYNGIEVRDAADCWIRNVKFLNADSGIFISFRTHFCTMPGIYFSAYEGRAVDGGVLGMLGGHHALQTQRAGDNLFTEFEVDIRFVHDITLDAGSTGNVFSKAKGLDINFDHHRRAPFENLFSDIDVGKGDRIWLSSGGGSDTILSPHSAARETFWNIRARSSIDWPTHTFFNEPYHSDQSWGPDQMNLVGITTINASIMTQDGKWFEAIDPDELFPQDLHLAQLARRLRDRTGH